MMMDQGHSNAIRKNHSTGTKKSLVRMVKVYLNKDLSPLCEEDFFHSNLKSCRV